MRYIAPPHLPQKYPECATQMSAVCQVLAPLCCVYSSRIMVMVALR